MNKNAFYLAIFGVLCVLAGVLVGAGISRRPGLAWPGRDGPDFRHRAEHFMGYRHKDKRGGGGLVDMLAKKLELSARQKAQVSLILEKTRQEIDQVGKDIRKAIFTIREKSDKEIMEILTPQQQERFRALQEEFRRHHSRRLPGAAEKQEEACPAKDQATGQ